MFERKANELPPLKYNVGDKIMGYHSSVGWHGLVGGEIIEATQSKSYLEDNEYKVKLEPELCSGKVENIGQKTVFTGWLAEKEAQPFDQDIWNNAVKHWLRHCELNRQSYLEYIRVHMALRGEESGLADEDLEKLLEEKNNFGET